MMKHTNAPRYAADMDDESREAFNAYHREYRLRRRAWVDSLKAGPCTRCGRDDLPPHCKDFHHRDRTTKSFTLGPATRYGKERILAEIAKCDLLCAICHRMVEHAAGYAWTDRAGL